MSESPFEIRELTSNDDCRAGVELQREIWGFQIGDIVPASLFHIVSLVGGLAAGAFGADGAMLGFVFGVSGVRDGMSAHWSHMLAVREPSRNSGVGRALKEFQRTTLARIAVRRVYWTFDPLQSKNAYFNVHRLGAQIDEYVPDMYGDTGSPLHLGLPTDRLIVHVETSSAAHAPVMTARLDEAPVLTPFPRPGDVVLDDEALPDVVLIEAPTDIMAIRMRSLEAARSWRLGLRANFQWALSYGYVVNAIHRDAVADRAFYVATRPPAV